MGVFDIKSNGLVIANNGETKLINKHCFNNKKARFVNVEIPPTKLTYRISALTNLGVEIHTKGIFIQARPIESTDDNDFVGLLGVITVFDKMPSTSLYANEYLYYYANIDKRKYLSEYGVVDKDTENETFYTNGGVIQTVDISSFPENPTNTILYRIIENGEKHYYRYYSDSNIFVRVYFSTDILDLTFIPSMGYKYEDLYYHRFNGFQHNTYTHTFDAERADYIPSVLVSNNIANKIVFPNSNYTVSPIKMTDRYSHISAETNLFTVIANRSLSSDNKYYVNATYVYYRTSDATIYNLYLTMPCKILKDSTSGAQNYGGKLMLYYQEMHDYFAEIFPEITDDMTLSQIDEYIHTEHTSPYSFIWFKPFSDSPISEDNIKKDINGSSIFPIIIKDVPNDELSELYFCQSEESASKEGYPTTYIGQPMKNKRMAFNVPYSVAFLNSKVPGHFPYTTYNIWSGKRAVGIILPQSEYIIPDSNPISARRCNSAPTEYLDSYVAAVFPDSYIVDPVSKKIHTSGDVYFLTSLENVYESYSNIDLSPVYDSNNKIIYWEFVEYGEYDPEQMGYEGDIKIRLYSNDSEASPNELHIIYNFDQYTYGGLIGVRLNNFDIKGENTDRDISGTISVTSTVSNTIYDVASETEDVNISYSGHYHKDTRTLEIALDTTAIKYPICTTGTINIEEQLIDSFLRIQNTNINFNFIESSEHIIINPDPTVEDIEGPTSLTTTLVPGSLVKVTDYYDPNLFFTLSRRQGQVYTTTINFNKTMEWDTSKKLYLCCNLLIYDISGGITIDTGMRFELNYNSFYRGWYTAFYDNEVDEDDDYTLGFIRLVITNTGITVTLDDYATYNNDDSAWTIRIRDSAGLSLYQEED